MSNCNGCPSKNSCSKSSQTCGVKNNPKNNIKNVIGVMSGKGGVGKSTVSALLAKKLSQKGFKVGIMDADVTGPSIARLLMIDKQVRATGNSSGEIFPVEKDGIKVISLNLLIEDENQPVIWRGSLLSNCINQFWHDVIWGELDYLIIDMPPGTSDVNLTIMQSIPVNSLLMVSIPQSMVSMIVTKAINMAKRFNINILGLVQNMSYILCPDCKTRIDIHDKSETDEILKNNNIKLLAEFPITKGVGNISNNGFDAVEDAISMEFEKIIEEILK